MTSSSASTTTTTTTTTPIIQAILFDMDGTLLDTESLSDKALLLSFTNPNTTTTVNTNVGGDDDDNSNCKVATTTTAATIDDSVLPVEIFEQVPMNGLKLPWELKKQILGLRGSEWGPIVLNYAKTHWTISNTNNDNDTMPDAIQLWQNWERNLNHLCQEVTACPGAVELIHAIVSNNKNNNKKRLPMAIATSSRSTGVAKKRIRHNETIFRYMDTIVAGDDKAVKSGKPSPDIYIEAARRLNVDPCHCLVFEDALSGVRAGKAAGCTVVAIPDERYSVQEKSIFEKEADLVLSSLWDFDGRPFGINVNMASIDRNGQ